MDLALAFVTYLEPHDLRCTLGPPEPRPSSGPACPRCGSGHVHKWGLLHGRQRYRCKSCTRTFTELTGTPLAHLKRQEQWGRMGWCLWEGLSVRNSARVLGVHPFTAFRWRHRFLAALRAHQRPHLTGVTELTVASLVAYRVRLMSWLHRFRRVSAKYYSNYLAWFSFVDEFVDERPGQPEAGLRSLLSTIFAGLSVDLHPRRTPTGDPAEMTALPVCPHCSRALLPPAPDLWPRPVRRRTPAAGRNYVNQHPLRTVGHASGLGDRASSGQGWR